MDIRSNPEQIDPAWMTAALQVRCPGCVVTGLQGEIDWDRSGWRERSLFLDRNGCAGLSRG